MDTYILRKGIVLGNGGGMLGKLLPIFRLGLGGTVGSGKQPFSWIHIDDLTGAYLFLLNKRPEPGIYHLCAPEPTTNEVLTKALGAALHRPTFFPVPVFGLKLLYGEGASVMAGGQRVFARKLAAAGFSYRHPEIREAVAAIVAEADA